VIDVTSLKSPGWQRIVAELTSPAGDDRAFLDRLLRVLAQASAARQAVLLLAASQSDQGLRAQPIAVYPGASGSSDRPELVGIMAEAIVQRAAVAAFETNQSRAFSIEKGEISSGGYASEQVEGYILSVPLLGQNQKAVACVTLLIEPRSKQAVQSTLAMSEVLSGYTFTHALRQELGKTRDSGQALLIATQLIAGINAAEGFKGAGITLVNELVKSFAVDRAALGIVRGDTVRVEFLSDTEHFDRRMSMVQKLQAAMDECLDQEQAVCFPAPSADGDVLLSQAITHSHRELASGDATLRVTSVPLRRGDQIIGVITLESRTPGNVTPIEPRKVELLQATMDLVAPVLDVRRSDDRALPARAWESTKKSAAWLVGAKHTAWKLAGLAILVATLYAVIATTTYRVSATGEIQPTLRRFVTSPFEGVLLRVGEGIEPGATVEKDTLLAELDTRELILQRDEAQAKLDQALKAISTAMKESKTAEVQKQQAMADAARAQFQLYQSRIERSRITAPVAGVVINGQLKDKLGASLKTGDELFQVAPLTDLYAMAKVDESDIALIQVGGKGQLVTRSRPDTPFDIVIDSIVPLAEARDGKNVFVVRVRLLSTATWMRPGMEGVIRLDAGERSLLWIGTRRLVDAARLWLW
jgi:biotin carboxyl carrier protein